MLCSSRLSRSSADKLCAVLLYSVWVGLAVGFGDQTAGEGVSTEYRTVLDHLYGPTRVAASAPPGRCPQDAPCRLPDYYRVPPADDPKELNIVVLMESDCPMSFNFMTEKKCNNDTNYVRMGKCLDKGLPFAKYTDPEVQREKSGYYKSAYTAVFRRAMPVMWGRGWKHFRAIPFDEERVAAVRQFGDPTQWRLVGAADIIICSVTHFRDMITVFPDKRYILVTVNDAATISIGTRCDLEDGRILAMLQHTSLNPLTENNEELKGNRRHFFWLSGNNKTYDSIVPVSRRPVPLSPAALDKIELLIPQIYRWKWPLDCGGGHGSFTVLQSAFENSYKEYARSFVARLGRRSATRQHRKERVKEAFIPFSQRKYDITLVSTISNRGNNRGVYGINTHRTQARDAVLKLKKKHPHLNIFLADYKIHYRHFIEILRDSKIFISPFGLGEFSGKDYEAMLSGSILVKPLAHKLKAYPNIYDERYTLNCAVNFRDLEEVVMPYLSSSMTEARNRIENSLKLLQRYAGMEQFSDDLEALLLKVTNQTTVYDPRGCYRTPDWAVDSSGSYLSYETATKLALDRSRAGLPVYKPHTEVDANFLLGITPPPPSASPPTIRHRRQSVQLSTSAPPVVRQQQQSVNDGIARRPPRGSRNRRASAAVEHERLAVHIRHMGKPLQEQEQEGSLSSNAVVASKSDAQEASLTGGSQIIELPDPHRPDSTAKQASRSNPLSWLWHTFFG